MLDFYLIKDEQPSHYSPKEEYAGGIGMREFKQAHYANIIEPHLDYFKDFRWASAQVKEKLVQIEGTKSEQFGDLRKILQRAMEMNCGVMAYCD